MRTHHLIAPERPERLDKWLASALPDISRSQAQALIEAGAVTLAGGGALTQASRPAPPGAAVTVTVPDARPGTVEAQADVRFGVVYDDADLIVINKPPGLTTHPAPGAPDRTLVNGLLARFGTSLSGIGGVQRPGIVHRLDKDTSGLMVVAKHDRAHRHLSAQLETRTLSRRYLALCHGMARPPRGTVTTLIGRNPRDRKKMAVLAEGGKHAVTHYDTREVLLEGALSLIACTLETGRTHQIRVHLAHKGCPIVGDPVYGHPRRKGLQHAPEAAQAAVRAFGRQALHAEAIGFVHPESQEYMEFQAPMPEDMAALIACCRAGGRGISLR